MKKFLLLFGLLFFGIQVITAQNVQLSDAESRSMVLQNAKPAGLSQQELKSMDIEYAYQNKETGISYIYLIQTHDNYPVRNQLIVLAFKNGIFGNKSGGFIPDLESYVKPGASVLSAKEAIKVVANYFKAGEPQFSGIGLPNDKGIFNYGNLGIAYDDVTAQMMWEPYQNNGKLELRLSWQVNFPPNHSEDWWSVRVDANTGEVLSNNNFTVHEHHTDDDGHNHSATPANNPAEHPETSNSPEQLTYIDDANYTVIPYPQESPLTGTAAVVTNPWTMASQFNANVNSLKWHSTSATTQYNLTRGNNVWATEDVAGANSTSIITPTGLAASSTTSTQPLNFTWAIDYTVEPTTPNFQKYAITNLFYWNNITHNMLYNYGFDEVAGNFQSNNMGRGGATSADYVIALAQSGTGTNNANFSSPPDGSRPRMRMYLWSASPKKDGDLDNGVVVHEYAHGISNRLTGSPSQGGCLSNDEQGGEGWSDYYSLMLTTDWATAVATDGYTKPRAVGRYVSSQGVGGGGIRRYKYCTNMAIDPLTYNHMSGTASGSQSHNIGEIWCSALWDMTWDLIAEKGISANLFDPNATGGNTIAMKLVTEGLKLQPCNPGFIDARDAIIAADQLLYNGAHRCIIIKSFARRGMGVKASQGSSGSTSDHVVDFSTKEISYAVSPNVVQQQEGDNIVFTHKVTAGPCSAVTGYTIKDTLPTNVTYISGGTYDAATRVVTIPVNLAAGATANFDVTVKINTGSYFPAEIYFSDSVTTTSLPNTKFETTGTTSTIWTVTNSDSHSPSRSYKAPEITTTSELFLTTASQITVPSNPPLFNFWHLYNTEAVYDGGIVEISNNNGTTWFQVNQNLFVKNGYNSLFAEGPLANKRGFSGSSNGWIQSSINLNAWAGQNVKLRFRFATDEGTKVDGWYIDDISFMKRAEVNITSKLYTDSSQVFATADTSVIILPFTGCSNVNITTQPVSQTLCSGSQLNLNVVASGAAPYTYQWQVSTTGCNGTFTNITNATNASYIPGSVTNAMNGYAYRVIVSNGCPSKDTSACAVLTVTNATITINTQPVNQTACVGANATFTVAAAGAGLSYQWQVSTDGGTTYSNIAGATSATYSFAVANASQNGNKYRVNIINNCTANGIFSNAVTLSVGTAPEITTQPADAGGCAGSSVSFTVAAATGSTYQWQVSTDGTNFTNIAGATNATYNIASVTAGMNGNKYRVIVTNTCGNTTSNAATLTISAGVNITAQPQAVNTCAGSQAIFTVTATGASTYQWQVSTTGCGGTFSDLAGQTGATLTINSATPSMNGYAYRVIVGNGCPPNTNSSCALLIVNNDAAVITTQPQNQTGCVGATVNFTVAATGAGLTYQWQKSSDNGVTWANISGATSGSYSATITAASGTEKYRVIVGSTCNTTGITSQSAGISVTEGPAITTQPANAGGCSGSSVSFTVAATGVSSYQWQVSTDGTNFTNIAGATSATYSIASISAADDGKKYRVIVSGTCGNATSNAATLSLSQGVAITAQPQAITACLGSAVSFAVTATGASTYQWQVSTTGCGGSFTDLAGETSATLSISNATASMNNYAYRVIVGNGCPPPVTSSCALLSVNNETVAFTAHPQNQSGCVGTAVSFAATATGASVQYQWQRSSDGGTTWSNINNATSASYGFTIANESENNNKYRVVLTSSCNTSGLNSNAATLTVNAGVSITTQPESISYCEGATANFSVAATNSAGTQWQVSTDGGTTWNNISGETGNTLILAAITTAMNNNRYRAVFANTNCGSINSEVATLTIANNLTVTLSQSPGSGNNILLTATTNATGPATYTWFYGNHEISTGSANTLQVSADSIGSYHVEAHSTVSNCNATSNVIEIQEQASTAFTIFPSPNYGNFHVTYYHTGSPASRSLVVYDSKGARVFSKTFTVSSAYQKLDVNITKYPAGTYHVVLYDKDKKKIASGKVVKQ